MEKGFYMLEPKEKERIENLFETLIFLENCGIHFFVSTEETKDNLFKTGCGLSFVRNTNTKERKKTWKGMHIPDNWKTFRKKFRMLPKITLDQLLIPLWKYQDQMYKKVKLSDFLTPILMNYPNSAITEIIMQCKEVFDKKVVEVKNYHFNKAAELREEEKILIEKADLVIKNQINVKRGFKWVTYDHVIEIAKEIK